MTDVVFDKLLVKLSSLGNLRGLTPTKVLIVTRSVNGIDYHIALSKIEPAASVLPFNILWMPFGSTDVNRAKLLRRTAKEADPLSNTGYVHTWVVLNSIADILSEQEYYDVYDATLRGDYSASTPVQVYPAEVELLGKTSINMVDPNSYYPVAAGDNDVRMYNSRPPLAHTHSEFNGQPGIEIKANNGVVISLETMAAPTAGDVLFLDTPYSGSWRKPKVSDIINYVSPVESMVISCPAAVQLSTAERTNLNILATGTRYSGEEVDLTDSTVFSVSGHDNITITGNVLHVGEIEESLVVVLTASYHEPIQDISIVRHMNLAVVNIPAVASLSIQAPDTMDELTTIQAQAIAHYTDGSSSPVTNVQWSVDRPSLVVQQGASITANDVSAGSSRMTPLVLTAVYTDTSPVPITVTATKTIQIIDKTPLVPMSLTIVGPSTVAEGMAYVYTPRVTYNNGLTEDVSIANDAVIWSTAYQDVVSFGEAGEVIYNRVVADQEVSFSASLTMISEDQSESFNLTATKNVTVEANNVVVSVSVYGPDVVDENSYADYTAVVNYDDGLTQDVSADCLWSMILPENIDPHNASVITFHQGSHRLVVGDIYPDVTGIQIKAVYTANDVDHERTLTVKAADDTGTYPASIAIVGPDSMLEQTTSDFSVQVTLENGSTTTVTDLSKLTWSSSDSNIAMFNHSSLTAGNVTENKTVDIHAVYHVDIFGNTLEVYADKTVTVLYNPPVVLSVDVELAGNVTQVDEKTSTVCALLLHWSDGVTSSISQSDDSMLNGSMPYFTVNVASNIAEVLYSEQNLNWVLTTGNVTQDQQVVVSVAWEDTVIGHVLEASLPITVKRTAPEIVSMTLTGVGIDITEQPVVMTEVTNLTLSISGTDEENGNVAVINPQLVDFEVNQPRVGLLNIVAGTTQFVVSAGALNTGESPVTCSITATYQQASTVLDFQINEKQLVLLTLDTEDSVNAVPELSSTMMVLTAEYDNGLTADISTNPDVVWSTSDENVATVSSGVLNTLNVDSDQLISVQATYQSMTATVFDITVVYDAPDVVELNVTMSDVSISEDETTVIQMVEALFDDESTRNVTNDVVITVEPADFGQVTNNVFYPNAEAILADQVVTLHISYNGFTVDTNINVAYVPKPDMDSLTLEVTSNTLFEGDSAGYMLTVMYDTGNQTDLTDNIDVQWNVSDVQVLSRDDITKTVTALPVTVDKSCTLSATWNGTTREEVISVKDIHTSSIHFSSLAGSLIANSSQGFSVNGHRTNDTVFTIDPNDVVFTSDQPSILEVVVTGNSAELVAHNTPTDIEVLVDASYQGLSASEIVVVESLKPVSFVLSLPATVGERGTYTVDNTNLSITAVYNDGSQVPALASNGFELVSNNTLAMSVSVNSDMFVLNTGNVPTDTPVTLTVSHPSYPGVTGTATVMVNDIPQVLAVEISSPLTSPQFLINEGGSVQLAAVAVYDNGRRTTVTSSPDITWVSNRVNAAAVSATGKVQTYNVTDPPVVVTITATFHSVVGTYTLRVVNNS